MGKVSLFLGGGPGGLPGGSALWSRGLKEEETLPGDKEDGQPHEVGPCPLVTHRPPAADGMVAGACLVSPVVASWGVYSPIN